MTSDFIKTLMTSINTVTTCYFEEADSKATLPYAVVQSTSIRSFENQEDAVIEVAIYQKDGASLIVETISETLKGLLNKKILTESGKFTSHMYFESSDNLRDPDSDIISRRMTFTARIFYL
jgi:hypothetical protein